MRLAESRSVIGEGTSRILRDPLRIPALSVILFSFLNYAIVGAGEPLAEREEFR